MTVDLLAALVVFAAIGAFTPGPNNAILMASGINFGLRRTVPTILGVALGFPAMIALVGLGLGRIFAIMPALYTILKYAGTAYMLWLAWKIASAERADESDNAAVKPMTFLQSAAFQWVNPKGWVIAVTALSAYTVASEYYTGVATVVVVTLLMGISSATTWALFGVGLRHVMNDPRHFRIINVTLALLLVASLWPMLLH